MAYIGKTPTSGDFVLLDSITTSATASYTMQRNSVNFEPQSANHMILSLNGTIQAPVSSFTVSGSTLTFASALTSSDVIDFILVLGNVNDVGVASSVVDSAITKNKTDFITDGSSAGVTVKGSGSDSGSIALNCSSNSHAIELISPDHSAGQSYKLKFPDNNVTADKFLKVKSITGSGATATGQLEFADAGGVNTPYFRMERGSNQSISSLTETVVAFQQKSFDSHNACDLTNYKYVVPSAGKYLLSANFRMSGGGSNTMSVGDINIYKNTSVIAHIGLTPNTGSPMGIFGANTTGLHELAANDELQVKIYIGAGSARIDGTPQFSFFSGFKLIE